MLNIDQLRQETPGCQTYIHLNNAGGALPTRSTVEAVKEYLDLEASLGCYEAAEAKKQELEATYRSIATMINAHPDEIALQTNATCAWHSIFYALPFQAGERILIGRSEYISNYLSIVSHARQHNLRVHIIDDDAHGVIDLHQLKHHLDDDVALVALAHIPTNNGLINPAPEVGALVKNYRAFYLLDACQSVGQLPIDVRQLHCDFLITTGRKYLRAPRGTGFLYIRRPLISQIHPARIDLGGLQWYSTNDYQLLNSARRFETFETNKALQIGLKMAVDQYCALKSTSIVQRIQTLAASLRTQLSQINDIQVCDRGKEQCGIVTFCHLNISSEHMVHFLTQHKVHTSLTIDGLTGINLDSRHAPNKVRASLHIYNTEKEIEQLCHHITHMRL